MRRRKTHPKPVDPATAPESNAEPRAARPSGSGPAERTRATPRPAPAPAAPAAPELPAPPVTPDAAEVAAAARPAAAPQRPWSRLGELDLHLFNEGRHDRAYEKLGAHLHRHEGVDGAWFAVWAPAARYVAVIGDFNGWDPGAHPLVPCGASGIWETFVPGVGKGAVYKFRIESHFNGYKVDKADPYGRFHEVAPRTASIVWHGDYEWGDERWMAKRGDGDFHRKPISIYELHIGSWRKLDGGVTYRNIADPLIEHVRDLGFTHVEFMPVMEHPFDGSWGYQVTGLFAPTSRFGTPEDLKYLIDRLHQADIGVILDWVPSHFPLDAHGLAFFDGTHLYEHADPRQGFHPDWKTAIFNFGRAEVVSFLVSSARFWLAQFHADGLRVDAVASMLYLDYSRDEGGWIPNEYGGRENLDAIRFLRRLNEMVGGQFPGALTIAEESTAWPMVSRPTSSGGLGFHLKWDMGWMHDTLRYMQLDPIHRKFHHADLTFRGLYAWNENFVLPLSHDEVVHGKGSLLRKMHGDLWQRFANLRALLAAMYATPGKKLLFMGAELATWNEWYYATELDWHLLQYPSHRGVRDLLRDLNRLYREHDALHEADCEPEGFTWLDVENAEQSVCVTLRRNRAGTDHVVVAMNFTPVPRTGYRVGVPLAGRWREILNTDAQHYGGSGVGNPEGVTATGMPWSNQRDSVILTLPPLAVVMLAPESSG
ncbi:MAG: 1,4-alpha-glucan branching protein GlgB [Planctomycetes bacterium]|nr:1,4-alpha-glucan branching protein GlgB [Planctomycetota bacterium]